MKIAILGRQPSIGIGEIESVYGGENLQVLWPYACLIDTEKMNVSHFGSILKTGEVVLEISSTDWRTISEKIVNLFVNDFSDTKNKITLGVSVYDSRTNSSDIQRTTSIIKQKLKAKGVSVRTIPSKTPALSTAVSHNNKLGLSDNKIEILAVVNKNKTYIAVSEGAQNITA